jgi:hypothetical protein
MSLSRGSVERRIVEAVLLVLAGCQKSAPAQPNEAVVTPSATPSASAQATSTALTVASTPAPDPTANRIPPLNPPATGTASAPDSKFLCKEHMENVKVDLTKAKVVQLSEDSGTQNFDKAFWVPHKEQVLCVLTRSQEATTIEVTHTPVCCPGPGPQKPCPPARKEKVAAKRLVVERAALRRDGTVVSSELQTFVVEKNPEQQHHCGRQPEGLQLTRDHAHASQEGAVLAQMAELEAASAPAFQRLARELEAHGAPSELAQRATQAARDEVRHTRILRRLAQAHGGRVGKPTHATLVVRDLLPIAIENAIEGCVREAYGALVASLQAERASPSLRPDFCAIAKDEREHAALAEAVDQWLAQQLDEPARAQVAAARSRAQQELRASLEQSTACPTLGLPERETALALFDCYFAIAA